MIYNHCVKDNFCEIKHIFFGFYENSDKNQDLMRDFISFLIKPKYKLINIISQKNLYFAIIIYRLFLFVKLIYHIFIIFYFKNKRFSIDKRIRKMI